MSIFQKIKERDFHELLALCGPNIQTDPALLYSSFKAHLENHLKKDPDQSNACAALEKRWYDSLREQPDYSVYSDPFYFCDIWLCWTVYSRKSVLAVGNPKSFISKNIAGTLGAVKTVLDLGCGFGYTTAGLKEIFPEAEVIGTNLEESFQFKIANTIGAERGFKVTPDSREIQNVDLAFASEYFEHFERPIEHLHKIVTESRPRVFVLANGFNGRAIGHFDTYKYKDQLVPNSTMSRWFSDSMRHYGYEKLKTKIWNNRPAIWVRR